MIKHAEYTRHGITEPMLLIMVYKKVEDGKIVSAFRFSVYKNMIITVYEDDKLQGGEVLDFDIYNMTNLINKIRKYYDDAIDDLVIFGEKQYVDEFLNRFLEDDEELGQQK
ncbi:MAG: hypothetical protein RRA45_08210 [Saccharolobus sp.]|jgi:hypothetical protein|uniref:hypothetical protein n=1 Tax=Saccharolobus sp. TaxID=2100761 RepID=UPI0028CCB921|nr:hypothetical protein [Saccharolobus sp.]MDT7862182.1 hypothetical protein [Saccharolobus sp.]